MKRKKFKDINEIKKLGILLRIADIALQESLILISNEIGKTDILEKRIIKLSENILQLRSDIDDDLIRILDIELYRNLSDKELNELMYPDINENLNMIINQILEG